jgi:hypothetical protein
MNVFRLRSLGLAFGLFFLVSNGGAAPRAGAKKTSVPLPAEKIQFTYQSFDGAFVYECEHAITNAENPYDWTVRCYEGEKLRGKYVAHVALTQYTHPSAPRLSLELLYWLTGSGIESEAGSTTWFHLREASSIMEVSSSQTVDQGTAGLYLDVDLAGE